MGPVNGPNAPPVLSSGVFEPLERIPVKYIDIVYRKILTSVCKYLFFEEIVHVQTACLGFCMILVFIMLDVDRQ